MLISKDINLEISHRLPNHEGKCWNFHGHTYKVEVGIKGEVSKDTGKPYEGMVMDYTDLKQILKEVLEDKFDHSMLISQNDIYAPIFAGMQSGFYMKENGEWFELENKKKQNIIILPFITTAENLSMYWYDILQDYLADLSIKVDYIKVWETPTSKAVYRGE